MSAREEFEAMGIRLPAAAGPLEPRRIFPKPARVDDRPELSRDKVIVKFVDALRVRLRPDGLRADGAALPEVDAILSRYPEARLARVFDVEERILDENRTTGELIGGRELADLNNFYLLRFPAPSERGVELANELLGLGIVETAYLQAPGAPPAPCADAAPATPSWEANQTHLDPAPDGVDAAYAWAYHAGGNGAGPGFWMADCEWAWCLTHEDYDVDSVDVLNGVVDNSGPDHGTAVLGIIGSCDNAYGMTGITPDISLKMCDFDSEATWAANIAEADLGLVAGEVMLLEIHILGPDSGLTCVCNCDQFEYVPVEWDAASFAAIQTAVANGIVVVEAAGNGSMDLDSGIYGGWFNPVTHNSGAIMVGAATQGTHMPECWTDYGSRVDVHGYGSNIYTTGYGWLWNQTGCSQDYTDDFGGTSGASPIVVGACVSLQGIANGKYGYDLSPAQMRSAIQSGSTPQGASSKHIGGMPDLENAINAIEPDVVASYAPAGWAYAAVPRPTNDSNAASVPLIPGALPTSVYINWTEQNQSAYSPTLNTPNALFQVNDTPLWECFNPNMAVGEWSWCGNVGPVTFKTGRHTILSRADWREEEPESIETNNEWSRQYIWAPLVLSLDSPSTRSWDPPATSTGWGPYYNCEGFSGSTGTPYWYAFAVMPSLAGDDFDVRLNVEQPMNVPQQGFGANVAWSSSLAGRVDFVVVDRNTVGAGTRYASMLRFSGTGSKVVEYDGDGGVVSNPGVNGPYTLAAGNLVKLHEIYLSSTTQTRIQVQWLGGAADFGVGVYGGTVGYYEKNGPLAGGLADAAPAHADEWVIVQPTNADWCGIVVFKSGSADLASDLQYNLIVSQSPNLTAATPDGWYGPVVPRNTTDATANWAPLPATLNGNQTTTSYNFSTYNEGPNTAPDPWVTRLYVDDVYSWWGSGGSLGPGAFRQWMNTMQGLDPYSLVRGGRHHLRLSADALGELPELFETDNDFVDWFVWTPYDLTADTPVTRVAPPVKDPLGYVEYAVDGFRSARSSWWTGVAVLPENASADYDVQLFAASTGSKDGFGAELEWSGDAMDGAIDFAFVNYNFVAAEPHDYGVVNWDADASAFNAQRASSAYHGSYTTPGVYRLGPFSLAGGTAWALHEFYFGAATPVHISLNNLSGGANLGVSVHDGTLAYHTKFSATSRSDVAGAGGDEHLAPIAGTGQWWCVAAYKSASADLPLAATYEIVVSIGGSAVDAPVVEPLPDRFGLSAASPNPFLTGTQVRLDVPANAGPATVAVFDLSGRRVAILSQGVRPAGRYVLRWDGRDAGGRSVAAGIYFVRMETTALVETRKLTLLR
jgi:hypothetical protein